MDITAKYNTVKSLKELLWPLKNVINMWNNAASFDVWFATANISRMCGLQPQTYHGLLYQAY